MRPQGSPAELERRRRRAMRLLDGGLTLSAVARMVGAAVSAVWQWRASPPRLRPGFGLATLFFILSFYYLYNSEYGGWLQGQRA